VTTESGNNVIDGDLADDRADDDNGNKAARLIIDARSVSVRLWARVDLDLMVDQVDDPVDGYARAAVDAGHLPVIEQAGVGKLDDHGDVGRHGLAMPVIHDRATNDGVVRFGFIAGRDSHRFTGSDMPARGHEARESVPAKYVGRDMRIALGHFGHQQPVNEMESIALGERSGFDQRLILIDRHPVER
jgi:hypothetical protein